MASPEKFSNAPTPQARRAVTNAPRRDASVSTGRERLRGYREALEGAGVRFQAELAFGRLSDDSSIRD
jgi:DNA-binding LacI/PurR family transcriptional regulator